MKPKDSLSSRGIVHALKGREKFHLSRYEPCLSLQPFVEHYWHIAYDLPEGDIHTQTVLSYPNLHLAFEEDIDGRRGLIYGVPSRPFERTLQGSGKVLGIKFRAGGQYPFFPVDASKLTGSTIHATEAFGNEALEWMNAILDAENDAAMANIAEDFLLSRSPERDKQAELVETIVQDVKSDRNYMKVEQMCERSKYSMRQLQRLFRKYVGVSPKWIIKRFRLQEAAERIENESDLQWTELAEQLGYFDQAHFIKDFRSVVGQSPSDYQRQVK